MPNARYPLEYQKTENRMPNYNFKFNMLGRHNFPAPPARSSVTLFGPTSLLTVSHDPGSIPFRASASGPWSVLRLRNSLLNKLLPTHMSRGQCVWATPIISQLNRLKVRKKTRRKHRQGTQFCHGQMSRK